MKTFYTYILHGEDSLETVGDEDLSNFNNYDPVYVDAPLDAGDAAEEAVEQSEAEERSLDDNDTVFVAVVEGQGQPVKIYEVQASNDWNYYANEVER